MASSSGSFLIRAPLTLDTDSDYESDGHKTATTLNSSGFESEEAFESGDEFETSSEHHFVTDPDEGILGSNSFGERNNFSGPFLAEPDDSSVENSSLDGGDGASVGGVESAGSKSVMPIAVLSMDDDEFDEAMGSEVEEGGFCGVAKVPVGVDTAPRVNVILGGADEDSEVEGSSVDDGPDAYVGVSMVNEEILVNEAPDLEENVEPTIEGNSGVEELEEVVTEGGKSTYEDFPDQSMGGSEKVEGGKEFLSDKDVLELVFGDLQKREIINDEEQGSDSPSYLKVKLADHLATPDQQTDMNSDEDMGSPMQGRGKKLVNHAALDALIQAATGVELDCSDLTPTSSNVSRVFSLDHSNRSDSSFPSSGFPSPSNMVDVKPHHSLSDEERVRLERVQHLRVNFLRLAQRLGLSPNDSVVARVLYKLAATSGSYLSQELTVESAKRVALQLEAERQDELDLELNILVLGKTGVGKSATINSVFCEERTKTCAFDASTTAVKELLGTINGVKIRIIDTPGLRSSPTEEATNRKILASVKKSIRKFPPDVVLYVDRLDINTRDLSDLPVLKSITESLGPSLWGKTIVTFTNASSNPPDGPSGLPLNYEVFVAQRSHMVQQAISKAVGNFLIMNPGMMHPVCLVENHLAFQKNGGERVLPNGQSWRPQLLLLCYSLKILSEASSLSKHEDSFDHQKLLGFRQRSLPLLYLLSTLLQSRPHPSLSAGKEAGIFDAEEFDLDNEDDEYDQLPPFKPLMRSQVSRLSKEQRKAYFEEYDYRVKLLEKKQLREEIKRARELKKKGNEVEGNGNNMGGDGEDDGVVPESVQVPLPDFVLPPSFDGDNPAYRYRSLESSSLFLTRPVLESHGWDHDVGYDGVSVDSNLAVGGSFPCGFAMQITKDKDEFNLHLDSSVCAEHGDKGSSMTGLDIQTMRRQLAYVLRGETKFKNFNVNETGAGLTVTLLGETVATGLKIEDQIVLGNCLVFGGSAGTVHSQGDTALGANLEIRVRDKDFPIEQNQTSFAVSLTKWRGDLNVMANLQSQFSVGRGSRMAVHVGLNNRRSGKISLKISSSEYLQLALGALIPAAISIFRSMCFISAAKAKH